MADENFKKMFNIGSSNANLQPRSVSAFSFRPTFMFNKTNNPFDIPSEGSANVSSNQTHFQFGQSNEFNKNNANNLFGTLNSSNSLSQGLNWTSLKTQNKPFSLPNTSSNIFFGNKNSFEIPTDSKAEVRNTFLFPANQGQKVEVGTIKPENFSFVKEYKNTTIQDIQCKKDQIEEKNDDKELQDFISESTESPSKYKTFPIKFEQSSKQGGRLFGRALAGVKTTERMGSTKLIGKKTTLEINNKTVFQNDNGKRNIHISSLSEDRRIASPEEIQKITSIVCKGIPKELNNKDFLSNHFNQFGKVKKIICNHKREYAVIRFYDHETAAIAKKNGAIINSQTGSIDIFWAQQSSPKKEIGRIDSTSEVADELLSMVEGIEDHKLLQRPEEIELQRKTEFVIQKPNRKNHSNAEKSGNIKPQAENTEEALWALMSSVASTPGEHYRILEARDKLLRLRQQKTSDITKAKAIVGICPDMCPEKERYSRAEKNCLSIFETTADKIIDHKAVVKEYSRSSADQEEPLPHELRPPDVLIKTMDYLLCNIIDLVEDDKISGFTIGEWYDFIWNRTRAIRKDITQQHLCSLKSVSLVEKCARFHIHCSAVLCEEDMAAFDAKINNENLTKCLQTLKHLYHDLGIQYIRCPHEPEFRAYDVLLNINESDILREIQQFPSYIRESEEIKFAISIFNAVNSNNYVKFFRLVRKTTYLNACLLHRYFSQVRIKALHTILKAYCIPNRSEQFPLSELIHILAFENMNDVKDFCQWLGLKSYEKCVILNRSDFVLPTSPLPVSRAYQLIESKRSSSVGEVINKDPLPKNPYIEYEPHDSFDEQGKLKKEAYEALDQAIKCKNLDSFHMPALHYQTDQNFDHDLTATIVSKNTCISEERIAVSHELNFSALRDEMFQDIIIKLITDVTNEMTQKEVERENFLEKFSNEIFDGVLEKALNLFIREISVNVVTIEKKEKLLLLEAEERERRIMEKECLQLIEEIISEEINQISKDIYKDARVKYFETVEQYMYNDIFSNCLECEIFNIANEIYLKEEEIKNNIMKAMQEEMELIRVRKVLNRWKRLYAKRCLLDYARKTFPSAPPFIIKNCKMPIQKKYALNFTKKIQTKHISDSEIEIQMKHSKSCEPLNLKNILWYPLFCKYGSSLSLYAFKLLLILPTDALNQSVIWNKWFTEKFKKGYAGNNKHQNEFQTLSLYSTEVEGDKNMLICIKSVDKRLEDSLKNNQELIGTNAFLLVISYSEASVQKFQEILKEEKLRLIKLITQKLPYPPIPLHIFIVNDDCSVEFTKEFIIEIENSLNLSVLKCNNLISDWNISFLNGIGKPNNDFQLSQSIKWLADNIQICSNLTASYLKDFLEDGITKFVFNLVYSDLAERQKHGIHYQCPRTIIALYVAAIDHMINVSCCSFLQQLSWPMPEIIEIRNDKQYPPLYWNSSVQLKKLQDIIRSIQLKEYPENLSIVHEDDVWQYINLITADFGSEELILKNNIYHLLSKNKNKSVFDEQVIPWADILQTCSFYLLDNVNFIDKENNKEWMIYYLKEEFDQFIPPEKWINATNESLSLADTIVNKRKNYFEEESSKKIKLSLPTVSSPLFPVSDVKEKIRDLNKELELEKETSRSFVQLLKKLVDEEVIEQETTISDIVETSVINHTQHNLNTSQNEHDFWQEETLESKLNIFKLKLESEKNAYKLLEAKLLLMKNDLSV